MISIGREESLKAHAYNAKTLKSIMTTKNKDNLIYIYILIFVINQKNYRTSDFDEISSFDLFLHKIKQSDRKKGLPCETRY